MSPLLLQDPDDPSAPKMFEEILGVCPKATAGGALFAYARKNGVQLLLEDDEFTSFLARGNFDLVIGVDGVTDQAALDQLGIVAANNPRLSVRVFLHARGRMVTFHPKLCWFATEEGIHLFVGSGNLTYGGLATNWEAYGTQRLDGSESAKLQQQWIDWKALHALQLRDLADPEVRARAQINLVKRFDRNVKDDEPAPRLSTRAISVLFAEIPRASNRWNQANFHQRDFLEFFQADRRQDRLLLWWLHDTGKRDEFPERRPGVTVASRNFRVELKAAAGISYPRSGRPIGVFLRTATRQFIYMLILPTSPHYGLVTRALQQLAGAPTSRMRAAQVHLERAKQAWPDSPLWKHTQ